MVQKKSLFVRVFTSNIILFLFAFLLFQTCSDDNPVTPPEANFNSSQLDTVINVDNSSAVISYKDDVNLIIPQGAVTGNTKLVISKLSDSSIPTDSEMEFPNAYEITLGDQHIFEKPLKITLKYDPEKLVDGIFKYKIGAAYYDEMLEKWALFKSVSLDTIQNTVSFSTNHLTKLSWYHLKYAYGYTDYISSPHFTIYWVDGKVVSDADYKSTLTNHKGTAPHYVQDILYYLEESWGAYKKNNLEVPEDTTDKVEVRVLELPKGEDGNTSFFGFVRLNQNIEASNNMTQEEVVKITCAHEFLHYVQDYYFMQFGAGNFTKWWLEATAVQADRIVWPNNSKFEAISYADGGVENQLERSWDDCNLDPNYYVAGGFLTYLTAYREGEKLSIPEIIIKSGKAADLSYFRTILDNHLNSSLSSNGIGSEYRKYVRWAFEGNGDIKINSIPPLKAGNAEYVIPVRLDETDSYMKVSSSVPHLAAKVVKVISPTSQGETSFKIKVGGLDSQLEAIVYVSDRNKHSYRRDLTVKDSIVVDLEQKSQWIDILVMNDTKDESGSFEISVELVQAPKITNITPVSAPVGAIVQVIGSDFGSMQNNSELWFGEVKALASDIVSWLDTQIEVKVPEGAVSSDVYVTVDEVNSNKIFLNVEGAPFITDIYDNIYYNNHKGYHKFTIPGKYAVIKGKNFGSSPTIRKVLVNNIEVEFQNWRDTSVSVKLPLQPTGNISIKIVSSNGESNETPYFNGLPVSYLNTAEPIYLSAAFYVNYYNTKAEADYGRALSLKPPDFSRNEYTWSNNILSVSINNVENVTGSANYTFAEDGMSIEKVELDYSKSNLHPSEIVHYVGTNYPLYEDYNLYPPEKTIYSFRTCGEDLETSTSSISGSLNYVDDLRADFNGVDYSKGCTWNSIYLRLTFTN